MVVVGSPETQHERLHDAEAPDQRAKDAVYLCDPGLKRAIADAGATPISFRPIRDLQRSHS